MIDLSRSTVLPGLFDSHTHLCMDVNLKRDATSYFLTPLRDPDTYRAVQGVANARSMLEAGFTSVRDVGNDGNIEAGSSPKDIVKAMIPTAAKLFGVDKERCAIRPQLAADIIATTGNPLEDITALKHASFVMKNGRVIKADR